MFDDDIVFLLLLFVISIFGFVFITFYEEKNNMTRKDILEKTEQYEKYDYCEKIDDKYYCFNEIEVNE